MDPIKTALRSPWWSTLQRSLEAASRVGDFVTPSAMLWALRNVARELAGVAGVIAMCESIRLGFVTAMVEEMHQVHLRYLRGRC